MRTGMTFSAISVFFGGHRTTISNIFSSVLMQLSCTTENFVFWPDKETVRNTMPECFLPDYKDVRVIIDCTEFGMEKPSSVDDRVLCYSNYKAGFRTKVLLGITGSGFISFKSLAYGGRKSDSQITIDSGLLDLLEPGDVILADKGFPGIQTKINEDGKKILLVMPPFLRQNESFTEGETLETQKIVKVRIHVERVMQRLRTYRILDKIPENLFKHIDDIMHMCSALVNLQPSIIAEKPAYMGGLDKSKIGH